MPTRTPSETSCFHSAGALRLAAIVVAIAAVAASCAGPQAQSPLVPFDASRPVPPVGGGEAAAPPPPDRSADGRDPSDMLDLDRHTRDLLRLRKRMREQAEARSLDAAREAQGSPTNGTLGENGEIAAAPSPRPRPQVIWQPVVHNASTDEPTYTGPANDATAADGTHSVTPPADATSIAADAGGTSSAAPPVLRLADLITPLKSQLAMQAADSASPLREHLLTAALLLLDGQRRVDPATLYDLTDREREVLSQYQDHFARLGESLRTGGGADAVIRDTQETATSLAAGQRLRITDFRLCRRIVNFGLYDEIESYKFAALRPTPLLTYVEIEGFKSVPGGEGRFITRVRHELELYTERDGELVYAWPSAPAEDVCGKARRDFFLPRQIQLPSNLTMGRYRLKVRIIDEQSQHQAESVIAFSIVAGHEVAARP